MVNKRISVYETKMLIYLQVILDISNTALYARNNKSKYTCINI